MKGNQRYYEDEYGNQYRYSVERQDDNKFYAWKVTLRKTKNEPKIHKFSKKRLAIRWCSRNRNKVVTHQKEVIQNQVKRQKERDDLKEKLKPTYTIEEKKLMLSLKDLEHTKKLMQNLDQAEKKLLSKMKSLVTRRKNLIKAQKKFQRRIDKIIGEKK